MDAQFPQSVLQVLGRFEVQRAIIGLWRSRG
ncbi:hypothetical protein AVMA1855_21805 [Acidovorax sp. SUPP1855]|nr:hypothetical protein AVMA1855_21805 [Acidovorax sp. SUPP1855]